MAAQILSRLQQSLVPSRFQITLNKINNGGSNTAKSKITDGINSPTKSRAKKVSNHVKQNSCLEQSDLHRNLGPSCIYYQNIIYRLVWFSNTGKAKQANQPTDTPTKTELM